jgi:hypothetical protein
MMMHDAKMMHKKKRTNNLKKGFFWAVTEANQGNVGQVSREQFRLLIGMWSLARTAVR